MTNLPTPTICISAIVFLLSVAAITDSSVNASRQDFDQKNLARLFAQGGIKENVEVSTFLVAADNSDSQLINTELLGLLRDRFAYVARQDGGVIAVAVPATSEDGFNGTIDLLVAIDMFGRITAARVLEDLDSSENHGVVDVIESKWMRGFSGSSMRDIQRLSWQTIDDKDEYDQLVGASITPRAIADRIYDVLVFFQTNRIAFMTQSQ